MVIKTTWIETTASLLVKCFESGHKVLIVGNGGSAAEAQHMAAEFVCGLEKKKKKGLRAMALTTDSSVITAWANDVNFSGVFARQVDVWGDPGDVLIVFSTSGKSRNCLRARTVAKGKRMHIVDMPSLGKDTAEIQENHLKAIHLLCRAVEKEMHEN